MKINTLTRIGFILAVAGSAIGLGNIWKFPYMTGQMGGGAFVLVYLLTVVFVGISLLIAEMLIGRSTQKDCYGAFETLSKNAPVSFKFAGFMAFSGLLILTFYTVVIGWIFHYLFLAMSGSLAADPKVSEGMFMTFLQQDIISQALNHLLAVGVVGYIVYKGMKKGIENTNLILMPLLIVIFLGLVFYAFSLPTFTKAFHFMFDFDFSKIDSHTILMAVGHSFFTLSIGMGAIMTYSASAPKSSSLFKDALTIAILDTLFALVAGLVIFTFLFGFSDEPSKGAGLVFISLPMVFAQMGFVGFIVGILFFIALSFAALTSAISILEPSIKIATERYGMSRAKAIVLFSVIVYVIGFFALISNSTMYGQSLTFGGKNLFDWLDFFTTAFLLPIGGIIIAIFVGFVIPKEIREQELHQYSHTFIYKIWLFSIRYIAPIGVLGIILNESGILG